MVILKVTSLSILAIIVCFVVHVHIYRKGTWTVVCRDEQWNDFVLWCLTILWLASLDEYSTVLETAHDLKACFVLSAWWDEKKNEIHQGKPVDPADQAERQDFWSPNHAFQLWKTRSQWDRISVCCYFYVLACIEFFFWYLDIRKDKCISSSRIFPRKK